jgi:hypothetical protein
VEQAFKELKGDLAIRPIYHQTDERIEAQRRSRPFVRHGRTILSPADGASGFSD